MPNPGSTWHARAAADFNGDGRADILWQNDDGSLALWEMNGTSFIGGGGVPNPGPAWSVAGGGDFNGDGKADILWQNADGTPAIWFMDGTTILGGGGLPNPGVAWHIMGAGDFNQDGHADILWQNNDGTPAIWLMNGTALVSGAALPNPGPSWHIAGLGDFNGDGSTDLLWRNDNGTPVIWDMSGTSIIGSATLVNPGSAWRVAGTGDFNGDGKADILWQNSDGTPVIWEMNGATYIGGGVAGDAPVSSGTDAAAPAADPPPTTAHNVVADTFFSKGGLGPAPNASDSDTFNLAVNNVSMTLYGLANTMSFVSGTGDTVTVQYPTGANAIQDTGTGTTFTINQISDPSLQHMVSITGFNASDTLRVSDGFWWKGLAPTITSDGNGGSLVTNIGGATFVDLVGVATVSVAQLQEFRAYV